jgi:hypothetical protein
MVGGEVDGNIISSLNRQRRGTNDQAAARASEERVAQQKYYTGIDSGRRWWWVGGSACFKAVSSVIGGTWHTLGQALRFAWNSLDDDAKLPWSLPGAIGALGNDDGGTSTVGEASPTPTSGGFSNVMGCEILNQRLFLAAHDNWERHLVSFLTTPGTTVPWPRRRLSLPSPHPGTLGCPGVDASYRTLFLPTHKRNKVTYSYEYAVRERCTARTFFVPLPDARVPFLYERPGAPCTLG